MTNSAPSRLIVGMTGATGTILGVRLLQALQACGVESHLVVSRAGQQVLQQETGRSLADLRSLWDPRQHRCRCQRRQQPPRPLGPELAEVLLPHPVPPGGQQIGDQVPAEHEEHVHAKEAARGGGDAQVKRQHSKHGKSADPIQAGCTLPLATSDGWPVCRLQRQLDRHLPLKAIFGDFTVRVSEETPWRVGS